MANTDLNIVLKLIDQATSKIKEAQDEIKKTTNEAGEESKKANEKGAKAVDKHKTALSQARKAVQDFKKELFIVALAVGAMSVAMKEFATRNEEARDMIDEAGVALKNLLALAGRFSPLLAALKLSSGAIKEFNDSMRGVDIGTDLNRARNEIKNFTEDLKNQTTLFEAGKISASSYYETLSTAAGSVIVQNQAIGASFKELASLQAELGNRQMLMADTQLQEQIAKLNFYKETFQKAHAGMAAFTVTVGQAIQTNLSSALTGIITGAMTAKEAFSQLGKAMIQTVVDFMVQKVVAWALEKTLLAGTVAATVAAGSAIAAGWAPAAFLATVATLGAAAAQAPVSLAASAAATAGIMTGLGAALSAAAGGANKGGGAGGTFAVGTPSVPEDMFAQVHKNEMIIPATFSEGVRRGDLTIGGPRGESNANGSNITVNVWYPKMSKKEEAEELASALGFNLQKELRYAR